MTDLGITLATICALLVAVDIVQLFRHRRAIDTAVLDHVIALAFIVEGKAAPDERLFATAFLTGDPHGIIPLRFPDYATYRTAMIAEHGRGA